MDWQALLLACRRANAAYLENDDESKAAFAALGDTWVSQLQDDSHQAVMSVDQHGETWLSISGTRASDLQLGDVRRDVQLDPVQIKGGHVTKGAAAGMDHVFDWAMSTAPVGTVMNLTGHSLGSVSIQIAPAYMPTHQIGRLYGYAAPKFIQKDFFDSYPEVFARMIGVLRQTDGWASWPWFDRRFQYRSPSQHVWLKNDLGAFQLLKDGNQWKGGFDFPAHDIDGYQADLDKIAAPLKPAA